MNIKYFIISIAFLSFQCFNTSKVEKIKDTNSDIDKALEEKSTTNINVKINSSKVFSLENEINREELVAFSKTFLGTPYVYAKQDPKTGFDCSGFINYVFKNYDIAVPRSSSGFKDFGKKIEIQNVKLGDVLVFTGYNDTTVIGHLGIVCEANGLNSKFIHASSGKVMQVTISDLNSSHYTKRFLHAVDVIKQ
jgi:cell wall-associated NlpC family hydrolase